MPEPLSNDKIKRMVSERLKQLDNLLKDRKLDEAHLEVKEIRRLDPTNAYARAFEERIMEMRAKVLQDAIARAEAEAAARRSESVQPREDEALTSPLNDQAGASTSAETESMDAILRYSAEPISPATEEPILIPRKYRSKALVAVIDDNVELLEEIGAMLEDHGMAGATFTTTDDAFTFLKENSVDLIICDVHLETSSFGGFTFYDKIRGLEHLQEVPFLFLSGMTDARLVYAGKELGADDYLTKPIDPEELMAVVRGKLRRFRQLRKK